MADEIRVAILDDYQGVALGLADWASLGPNVECTVFRDTLKDQDALAARLAPFDVIVAMRERTPLRRPLLERLPRLRHIVTTGLFNAAIDSDAAAERGISVSGTMMLPGSTAELVWGLILSLTRKIPQANAAMHAGAWQTVLGTSLRDKVLGIIGLGRLGTRIAAIAKLFDMDVAAWSPNLTDERAGAAGVRLVGKEALFRESDIVTVHIVLSDLTRGLIGADELGLMKKTAYLVNTSRGPLVDTAALVDALKFRRIAGAAIDVYDEEPPAQDHPLRFLDNAVLTPHIGYVTEEDYRIAYGNAVENIAAFLRGDLIRPAHRPPQAGVVDTRPLYVGDRA